MQNSSSVASLSNKVLMVLWFILFFNPLSNAFLWFLGASGDSDSFKLTVNGEEGFFNGSEQITSYLISNITILGMTLITWQLIKLFKLYKDGQVFTERNVKQYINISKCIILYVVFRALESFLFSLLYMPDGFVFGIEDFDVALIVTGVIVRLIAKVMHEAKGLYDEQSMTI